MRDKQYHFTGIKGSGMSALALILHGKGYTVQGSDVPEYFFTQKGLEDAKIPLFSFNQAHLTSEHTVIAGNAFPDTHEEIVNAKESGANVVRYHHFLGELASQYCSIAVTGSHGKTTTTGLLSHVLKAIKPTSYLIGDGTGFGNEDAQYFVLEACEYRRHFMAYHTDYAIITNVDFDHPDYYTDINDVFSAFQDFAKQTKKAVIACGEDKYLKQLSGVNNVWYYGFDATNDVVATQIIKDETGSTFDVTIKGEYYGKFHLPAYGDHNILNALAVITVCYLEQCNAHEVAVAMSTFGGVKRRFSEKKIGKMTVIDDYAHHPSEIAATLDAVNQKYPSKQVIAAFQPHTFTRTIALLDEFANVLSNADKVYLFDIFSSAREEKGDISIHDLAEKIQSDVKVLDANDLSELLDYDDAVIVFMGAGNIDKIGQKYVELLSQLQLNTQ